MPLNIFLKQELERFQKILDIVRSTMISMVDAIDGTTIMTPEIVDSINAVFDFRVPYKWQFDPTGAEISWLTPSLGGWVKGLTDRHYQLNNWISKERPQSFWLTGFFNPQGFLTAMKQEVARTKKEKGWALDEVIYDTDVTKDIIPGDDGRIDGFKLSNVPSEGVLVHGLFLEGAGWSKAEKKLEESQPKELYYQFPVLHVTATYLPRNEKDRQQNQMAGAGGARNKVDISQKIRSYYDCPVYKYPKRNDKYLIFRVFLKPEGQNAPPNPNKGMTPAMRWKLSGVSLLCCKD
jgi:dynein heavy chain